MREGPNIWVRAGTYGIEQTAIISAKAVKNRSYVATVRVVDSNDAVCWIVS